MPHFLRSIAFLCLVLICADSIQAQPYLIPRPVRSVIQPGAFHIDENTVILVTSDSADVLATAQYLSEMISAVSSFVPVVRRHDVEAGVPGNSILLSLRGDDKEVHPESYSLRISPRGARILAANAAGLFYGLQTLRQMLPARFESAAARDTVRGWDVSCCLIVDAPRFRWRGLLLDCARHFMDVAFIKRTIDLMAMLKLNRFHWHLTDDQGWRIQIRSHPALTTIGAWRKEADGSRYGGFYTQAQIREVVAHAASRHVTVVPEIEMPGHAMAALATYPHLSCTGGPFDVPHTWGVFEDVYCAGKSETLEFIEDVLTELMELFPSEYIHIGGDEVPTARWEQCAECRARMASEGLSDAHALQSWFLARIDDFLRSRGRKMIGWDEILEGDGLPYATVQSWRGMDGAILAARTKRDAIVSPTSHAYFDYPLSAIDLKRVYEFEPVPSALKPSEAEYILGGECNMWTERAPQPLVESKLFPRIVAMAEVLWTPVLNRRYGVFHKRLQGYYPRLDSLGIRYGFEAPPVRFELRRDSTSSALRVRLRAGQPGLRLLYIDPTSDSLRSYSSEIDLSGKGVLQAWANAGRLISDTATLQYDVHSAMHATVLLAQSYSRSYTAGGADGIVDGLRGSSSHRDGRWQGYQGVDVTVTLDLGKEQRMREITAGFLQNQKAWIFMPRQVVFSVSQDGRNFVEVGRAGNTISDSEESAVIRDFTVKFDQEPARYLRMEVESISVCPEWHPGAGGAAWVFIDEVIVR